MAISHPKIHFDNAPLAEVVSGIHFKSLEKFATPHIGIVWQRFQPDFPYYKELPVLTVLQPPVSDFTLQSIVPPQLFPRIWFTSEDDSKIVQVQRDRFLTNWKKTSLEAAYPHFATVFGAFKTNLSKFTEFLTENNLGVIEPLETELTYINLIPEGEGWKDYSDLSNLFPFLSWRWPVKNSLPQPLGININTSCQLPKELGSLFISIASAKRILDNKNVLQLSFTVKKQWSTKSLNDVFDWFDKAHLSINESFLSITNEEVQIKEWKRCNSSSKAQMKAG